MNYGCAKALIWSQAILKMTFVLCANLLKLNIAEEIEKRHCLQHYQLYNMYMSLAHRELNGKKKTQKKCI